MYYDNRNFFFQKDKLHELKLEATAAENDNTKLILTCLHGVLFNNNTKKRKLDVKVPFCQEYWCSEVLKMHLVAHRHGICL